MPMICPYCRTPVEPGKGTTNCEGCGTPHHGECYAENGGCTLFGCKFAPPDDPKVLVTAGEVSQAAAAGAAPGFAYAPVPSGFGDVMAPLAVAVPISEVPPPPPPPTPDAVPGPQPDPMPAFSTFLSATERPPKSRLAFILLGIFLGSFGAHNFYAGYIKRGVAQLVVTVGTVFYGSLVTWIWALIEVCTVDHDNHNVSFI